MKKGFKVFSIFMLVLFLAFMNVGTGFAAETEWLDFGGKITIDAKKDWTVKFSQPIDENSINSDNVYVKDLSGNVINTTLKVDGNLIIVSPVNPYETNKKYILYLDSGIKSTTGKTLKSPTKFQFSVEMGEPVIYPANHIPIFYAEEGFRLVVSIPGSTSDLAAYDEETNVSSIKLYVLGTDNKWNEVGSLFDSGNLEKHSDEIRGDGNYSIGLNGKIDTSLAQSLQLKVEVESKSKQKIATETNLEIIETSNGENVEQIVDSHAQTKSSVENFVESNPEATVSEVQEVVIEHLNTQENVKSVVEESEGFLEVSYDSGLKSYIQIVEEENEEAGVRSLSKKEVKADKENRKDRTLSERKSNAAIPLDKQTRGDAVTLPAQSFSFKAAANENEVLSRNVLLWAPFHTEFHPWNEEDELEQIFAQSSMGFNIQKMQGDQADLAALKNMSNYGFVLLSTHGSSGKWVLTGETIDHPADYEIEQILGEVAVTQHMILTEKNGVKVKEPVYAVNHQWFERNLNDDFNNTIIINSSCESTLNDFLWNTFAGKNAGAYYGYDDLVTSKFAHEKAIEIVDNLVNKGKTTGEAFVSASDPYSSNHATLELKGNPQIKFAENKPGASNLVNGDFEQGMLGWTMHGDVRAISGLGDSQLKVTPAKGDGMAIVSTALGYNDALGEFEQTFYLDKNASLLTFDWNFLSEEFIEYIDTEFDDPFVVTLTAKDGTEVKVLDVSVNTIAKDFGAIRHFTGGDLIHVSPSIVFDEGDVWMTDWQKAHFIIPETFKGTTVTIHFSAADAVDTIYDTAVLIDNIVIE